MDIDKIVLEILLRRIHFEKVSIHFSDNMSNYQDVSKRCFLQAARYLPDSTEDENEELYNWANEELKHQEGIYGCILNLAKKFLKMENSHICYKEENWSGSSQFLHWKEISSSLGQDIFLAAFLANESLKKEEIAEYLCIPFPQIVFKDLNQLLGRDGQLGLTENHFHLKGSFPVFMLNWTCLMNHIGDGNDFFHRFKEYRESESVMEHEDMGRMDLFHSSLCAASYRLHLYEIYSGIPEELQMPFSYNKDIDEVNLRILQDRIDYYRNKLEEKWDYVKEEAIKSLDYALAEQWYTCYDKDEVSIAGERYFLYCCFKAIFQKDSCFRDEEKTLFYKYLLIFFRIRSEMVQTNSMRGFKNFQIYQDRKEDVIDYYPEYQKQVILLVGCSLRKWQNISTLEMRISPKGSADETLRQIKRFDRDIEKDSLKKVENDYFYVLHFPKEKEKEIIDLKPRNYILREKMARQIEEQKRLIDLEMNGLNYGDEIPRVRGYDACAGEIGCRPEVFAPFYRAIQIYTKQKQVAWIHWTYHVGEDFLDLMDGLRAIDEVMQFCELPQGSRLGHGMALGIDAKKYYKMKNCKILLSRQDLIDNIAWTLGFCLEHGIVISEDLRQYLESQFSSLLTAIYVENSKGDGKEKPDQEEEEKLARAQAAVTIVGTHLSKEEADWQLYYDAWKLRGDRPELYLDYEQPDQVVDYDGALRDGLEDIRNNKTCREFYKLYHFSQSVRKEGIVPEKFKIYDDYIDLVQKIQEELMEILTMKQIKIECNPTSNFKIGPFSRFDQHPMLRMYGKNLYKYPGRMNVSINTDDMGVFQTSLEVEYATMYVALLKSKDEDGKARYTKEAVLKWLEDVKEFGHMQAFIVDKQSLLKKEFLRDNNSSETNYLTYIPD